MAEKYIALSSFVLSALLSPLTILTLGGIIAGDIYCNLKECTVELKLPALYGNFSCISCSSLFDDWRVTIFDTNRLRIIMGTGVVLVTERSFLGRFLFTQICQNSKVQFKICSCSIQKICRRSNVSRFSALGCKLYRMNCQDRIMQYSVTVMSCACHDDCLRCHL